ncbi:MAG: hypothetical protein K2G77_00960 [Muribaculaceae bacterium]|nr:hypothetical protein [Muribaculaceae bacterium]
MKKILMTLTLAFAAMIAIPTVANAQDAKPEQKTECCKEKKKCSKDDKACCKDGKACAKETGKSDFRKGKNAKRAHSGKLMRGEGRKMKGSKDAKMRRGGGENPMFKGITLSEDQKSKMKALREKNMTAKKKTKAEMKAKSKEEMQKLRADYDKEVEKILDKDQLKQYQANKAEMEARRSAKQAKLPKLEKKDK